VIKWAWAAVLAVIVVAGGIFVVRTVNAPDSPGIVVQTIQTTPYPIETTEPTTTTPAFVDPNPDQPTKVVNVVAGNAAPGYRVTDGGDVFACHSPASGIDAGIVSCAPTAAGADVCWATPSPLTVLCGLAPWEKSLSRMTTDGQVGQTPASATPRPWGLELADGSKCLRRNGGAWPGRADGLAGAYSCEGRTEFVLAGDGPVIDQAKQAWTVKIGGLTEDNANLPPPLDMRVVTAYFAASA
jgi:hypothetical protein